MIKHIQTIRRQKPKKFLSVFDHFVRLALKGLKKLSYCYIGIYIIKTNTNMVPYIKMKRVVLIE